VKPNKNDREDAEAICEAVGRPNMHFVPVKSAEQLAVQAVHRIRSRLVADRIRLVNQVRGLLGGARQRCLPASRCCGGISVASS
jgi:transposase